MAEYSLMAKRSLPLSTRVTVFFGLVALLGGTSLSIATYLFTRTSLLDQHRTSADAAAVNHARQLYDAFSDPETVDDVLSGLDFEPGGYAVVVPSGNKTVPNRVFSSRTGYSLADFPDELIQAAAEGRSARQQFTDRDGNAQLGYVIRIDAYNAEYLEAFPMTTINGTLVALSSALIIGTILTSAIAFFFGRSTSRRLLQPIARVADAAEDLAAGSLDARLDAEEDPDLQRVVSSFNEMADAMQERIGREQRFASDVSHELRSPITALTAAIEVLAARRDQFSERTQQALDVVTGQVRRFDGMVIDLLELSRIDAGAPAAEPETADIVDLTERVAARFGYTELPVEVDRRARRDVEVDRVRYERILGNLLDNATTHGGGPTRISIERGTDNRDVVVAVEDNGPGVARSEQLRIFERFARGSAARHRIGTGLGLALVAEHAQALGGTAWVEDGAQGGARFLVRLPASPVAAVRPTTKAAAS